MHFSNALDAFLSDPRIRGRLKPSTLRAYRTDLQAAALALPAQLAAIGPTELRAYLDQPIAPSTAARRLAALRALFAWAIREEHNSSDPTAMALAQLACGGSAGHPLPWLEWQCCWGRRGIPLSVHALSGVRARHHRPCGAQCAASSKTFRFHIQPTSSARIASS